MSAPATQTLRQNSLVRYTKLDLLLRALLTPVLSWPLAAEPEKAALWTKPSLSAFTGAFGSPGIGK